MTRTVFIFFDKKKKGYISTKILHKAKKKYYKNDIIFLECYNGHKKVLSCCMTPTEASIISNALLHAVVVYKYTKKIKKERRTK